MVWTLEHGHVYETISMTSWQLSNKKTKNFCFTGESGVGKSIYPRLLSRFTHHPLRVFPHPSGHAGKMRKQRLGRRADRRPSGGPIRGIDLGTAQHITACCSLLIPLDCEHKKAQKVLPQHARRTELLYAKREGKNRQRTEKVLLLPFLRRPSWHSTARSSLDY